MALDDGRHLALAFARDNTFNMLGRDRVQFFGHQVSLSHLKPPAAIQILICLSAFSAARCARHVFLERLVLLQLVPTFLVLFFQLIGFGGAAKASPTEESNRLWPHSRCGGQRCSVLLAVRADGIRGEQRSNILAQVERGSEVGWFREVTRSMFDAF